MRLQILGCWAAAPNSKHRTTSQVLEVNGHLLLLDCAEATQITLRQHRIKFTRIHHIFISHLHGDHVLGLVGLIMTFRMLNRAKPLHIYGPKGIKNFVCSQLKSLSAYTDYPLIFKELERNAPEVIFEDNKLKVTTIPLKHRIYANGYLFEEAPKDRKLLLSKVLNYNIDKAYFNSIKKGKDILLDSGVCIKNEELTEAPPPPKRYAFCTDTAYYPPIAEQLKKIGTIDVLYHEATFLNSHEHLCIPTGHSTAQQAGKIAKAAAVKQLILGHYSTRYGHLQAFIDESQIEFENTHLAIDGKVFEW